MLMHPCAINVPYALAAALLIAFTTRTYASDDQHPSDASALRVEFARKCEAVINSKNPEAIRELCDDTGFVERVMPEMPGTSGFHQGLRESLADALSRLVLRSVEEADSFTFLQIQEHDGEPAALFRLLGDSGLNYHRLIFTTTPSGELRIGDVYVTTACERFSNILGGLVGRSAKRDSNEATLADAKAVNRFALAARQGRFDDALQHFEELPETFRDDKALQVLRLACAVKVGPDPTKAAAEDFRRLFPDDPAAPILLLDFYWSERDFESASASLATLRAFAGEDAYIDFLEGNSLSIQGKDDAAKLAYQRAIEREPTLDDPHWSLLEMAREAEDHEATLRHIRDLERLGFRFREDKLRASEGYASFVASPQFEEWLKSQEPANAEAEPAADE